MNEKEFNATAWNNGKHHKTGAGYGIKIDENDRDIFFNREWDYVILYLEGEKKPGKANIRKKSFWSPTCREMISKEIGAWLIENEKAPWAKGQPPKLIMTHINGNQFKVSLNLSANGL